MPPSCLDLAVSAGPPRTIGAERRIDGTTKTLRFPDLGVTLNLTKEQVYMLEVYDPKSNH